MPLRYCINKHLYNSGDRILVIVTKSLTPSYFLDYITVMGMLSIVFYIGVFILILAAIYTAGRFAKKLPSNIIKIVNWISFGIAVISVILSYIYKDDIYKYILFASIIIYFIFYNYDSKKG